MTAEIAARPSMEVDWSAVADLGGVLARVDPANRVVQVGDVLTGVLGWTDDEVTGVHLVELLAPDWAATLDSLDQLRHVLLRGPAGGLGPICFTDRSGQERWLAVQALPMVGGDLLLLAGDVTDEWTRAGELERSDRLLHQAVLQVGIGCFDWSLRTATHRWSEELLRLCRLPRGTEPTEELILSLIHPRDRSRFEAAVDGVIATGDPLDTEVDVRLPDGSERVLRLACQALRGPDGLIDRVVGIVRDVTESRRLDAELHLRDRLEAVGRLTSGVAHDFNNLLMVIGGYVELAQMAIAGDDAEQDPTEILQHLDRARSSAGKAATLVHQLLVYARSKPGEPQPVDLAAAASSVAEVLERSMAGRARLEVDASTPGPVVEADPGQLEQIAMNLLINARDATGPGDRIRLEVAAVADGSGSTRALLMVTDDGAGMDEATRRRALEPFFTTKGERDGSGLGLATVHAITTALDGTVEILSSPGVGTTVVVELPASGTGTSVPEETGAAPVGRGQHVLVVDDDPMLCDLMARVLTAGGYRTTTSVDACAASEIAARCGDIEVLVSDVVLLDGSTGIELAAELRRERPDLPVVLVTGSGSVDAAPAHAIVLDKPVSHTHLLRAIAEALAG